VLEPFKFAMQQLEGQKCVTSSLVPMILPTIQAKLQVAADPKNKDINDTVRDCAKTMLNSFKKEYGDLMKKTFSREVRRGHKNRQRGIHPALWVAHALDPRFKKLTWMVDDTEREDLWDHILELLVEQAWQREQETREMAERNEQLAGSSTAADDAEGEEDVDPDMARVLAMRRGKAGPASPSSQFRNSKESLRTSMGLQLKIYQRLVGQEVAMSKLKEADPLEWWRDNHSKCEDVWLLACKYLSIPATSAPSERLFNITGNMISIRRCRLNSNLVDDRVIIRENKHVVTRCLKERFK